MAEKGWLFRPRSEIMDSFISLTGWSQTSSPTSPTRPSRPFGHFRSKSTVTQSHQAQATDDAAVAALADNGSKTPRRASFKVGSISNLQFALPGLTSPPTSPASPRPQQSSYPSKHGGDPSGPSDSSDPPSVAAPDSASAVISPSYHHPLKSPALTPSSPIAPASSSPLRRPPHAPPRHRLSYSQSSYYPIDEEMSTLPDPRIRALAPGSLQPGSAAADLNNEVATLSAKLINAINHQTTLDDALAATRRDLGAARERVQDLEAQVASQRDILSGDVWVRRSTVEQENKAWHTKVAEERRARHAVEAEKRKIEFELENLTAALFEEANKMVISAKEAARLEKEAMQRRNDQLKAQLADNEGLLRSQQEQLAELKLVMEQMAAERDDDRSNNSTAPSSPAGSGYGARGGEDRPRVSSDGVIPPPLSDPVSPAHPTSYTQLLQPVLRTDIAAFDDFVSLARASRARSGSRVSSVSGLNALGIGLGSGSLSTGSTPTSLSTAAVSSPPTPSHQNLTHALGNGHGHGHNNSHSNSSSPSIAAPVPTLRETKFFKRALVEDIEPTLRLEMAPGLSWLARRSVLNAICDGNLVVEPLPAVASSGLVRNSMTPITPPQFQPCSLCGENRRDSQHLRNHRLRASESDTAQRHPLCAYCLARVRSTGDFLGFMRMVRDGHWRVEGENAEAAAWEESVRLREQMFWARIGGGVVPAGHPVPTEGGGNSSRRTSREVSRGARGVVPLTLAATTDARPASTHLPVPPTKEPVILAETNTTDATTHTTTGGIPLCTPPGSNRNSAQALSPTTGIGSEQRLSLTIPLPPSPSVAHLRGG